MNNTANSIYTADSTSGLSSLLTTYGSPYNVPYETQIAAQPRKLLPGDHAESYSEAIEYLLGSEGTPEKVRQIIRNFDATDAYAAEMWGDIITRLMTRRVDEIRTAKARLTKR